MVQPPRPSKPSYPLATWRLILGHPAPGAWNMAVDEAILEAIEQEASLPTLRLYAWDPPCVSLGYAQPTGDIDLPRLAAAGWQAVRRPTGGRALLHTDELTYSVAGLKTDPRLAGSLLTSYRRIADCLLDALHRLQIPAQAEPSPAIATQEPQKPICFEMPSNYEITVAGKKLVGSAQMRRQRGLLQHGSLPLCGDITRLTQVLAFPDESQRQQAAGRLQARATTAGNILGQSPTWDQAAQAFIAAFRDTFNLILEPMDLSEAEGNRARQLARKKYALLDWRQQGDKD